MTTIGMDATSWSVERRGVGAELAAGRPPGLGGAGVITRPGAARGGGRLATWQERLKGYPDALRDRLITETAATWTAPAWWPDSVVTMWPLVARDARLALLDRLTGYVERGLRITFALSRRWEPDYKWLV